MAGCCWNPNLQWKFVIDGPGRHALWGLGSVRLSVTMQWRLCRLVGFRRKSCNILVFPFHCTDCICSGHLWIFIKIVVFVRFKQTVKWYTSYQRCLLSQIDMYTHIRAHQIDILGCFWAQWYLTIWHSTLNCNRHILVIVILVKSCRFHAVPGHESIPFSIHKIESPLQIWKVGDLN